MEQREVMNTPQLSPMARATALARFAKRLPINDQATANAAGLELNHLKVLRDDMRGVMKSVTDPLKAQIDAEKAKYGPAITIVEETMTALRGKIGAYTIEQQRIATDARAAADARIAAINAAAEAEMAAAQAKFRARAAAEAEAARPVEAPASAIEEPASLGMTDAEPPAELGGDLFHADPVDTPAEVEQQPVQSAAEAELVATAAAIAQKADDAAQMELANLPSAKVTGIRTTGRLDFRLDDLLAVVRFVNLHPEHIGLLALSITAVRAEIKKTGLDTKIDGITVFPANTVITTGKTE